MVQITVANGAMTGALDVRVRRYTQPFTRPHIDVRVTDEGRSGWRDWVEGTCPHSRISDSSSTWIRPKQAFSRTPFYFGVLQGDFSQGQDPPLFDPDPGRRRSDASRSKRLVSSRRRTGRALRIAFSTSHGAPFLRRSRPRKPSVVAGVLSGSASNRSRAASRRRMFPASSRCRAFVCLRRPSHSGARGDDTMAEQAKIPTLERSTFFDGQRLTARDLSELQRAHRELRWLHNRSLHGWGIGIGLAVTGERGATVVSVEPGYGVDCLGREIILTEPRTLAVPADPGTSDGRDPLTISSRLISLTKIRPSPKAAPAFACLRYCTAERDTSHRMAQARAVERRLRAYSGAGRSCNCRLSSSLSQAPRRYARPSDQPYIAAGQTEQGRTGWVEWKAGEQTLGVHVDVDTSAARFKGTPQYLAHVHRRPPCHRRAGQLLVLMRTLPAVVSPTPTRFTLQLRDRSSNRALRSPICPICSRRCSGTWSGRGSRPEGKSMNGSSGFLHVNEANQWPRFTLHDLEITAAGSLSLSAVAAGGLTRRGVFLGGPFETPTGSNAWYRLQVMADADCRRYVRRALYCHSRERQSSLRSGRRCAVPACGLETRAEEHARRAHLERSRPAVMDWRHPAR